MKRTSKQLDFVVDGITNSIALAATGERFETLVLPATKADIAAASKRAGWLFDWKLEQANGFTVYKLVTVKEPNIIQGMAAFRDEQGYVFMSLLESAPGNIGKNQKYIGVAGNLAAYGCLMSRQKGFDGCLVFISKTLLISHYEKTLGAVHLGNQRMGIFEVAAANLLEKYFPTQQPKNEISSEVPRE